MNQNLDPLSNIVKIQSILKLTIGFCLILLALLVSMFFFTDFLQPLLNLSLDSSILLFPILLIISVIGGCSYAIRVANQGNQKLAFIITTIFAYSAFYAVVLVSPFGFHDPGLYFVPALLIVASLFVGENALRFHTAIIITLFVLAFTLERTGLKETNWPPATLYELIVISFSIYLMQLLLKRTLFVLRHQSDVLNRQKDELIRYQTQLEDMVKARTSNLTQEKDGAIRENLAKSQSLANMSHELRTPLNAIIGYGELILDGLELEQSDENIKDDVSHIVSAGHNLLNLINHVLDFSKAEADQMTIRVDKFSVLNIINEAAGLISPLLAKTGNSLVIKDVDELLYAYGDVQKLRQVLINLLSNANKFTDEGSITISAGLELEYVTITVSDTGIGIEPNFIQHLFQPFSQVENDLNRQFQGTGLGLVISKKFIELMNGKIEVESVFGQGSSFKVLIPSQSPFGLIKAAYEENIGR